MSNILDQKNVIRTRMLQEREDLRPLIKRQYDKLICQELESLILERNYKCIHSYLPIGSEINLNLILSKLLTNKSITIVCPKTMRQRKLEHRILKNLEEVEQGIYKTLHPTNTEIHTGTYDLIIVPGLAVDADLNRLGYGAAYYDSFLVEHPNAHKLGLFYPFQKIEKVPVEAHDYPLDECLIPELN